MTIIKLKNELEKLIAKGHGRKTVCVDKSKVTHALESDGCCIIPVTKAEIQTHEMMDDDFVRLKAPAGWQVTAPEPLDTEEARDALLEAAGISKETPLTERARKRLDETLAKMVDDASEVKLETVDALPVARTAEEVTKRRSVLRKMQELARKWIGKR